MPKAPQMSATRAVRIFREAQSRAQNVAHDLDDLEWIDQTEEQVQVRLLEIQEETAQLLRHLQSLTGSNRVLGPADSPRCRACDQLLAHCLCEFGPQVEPTGVSGPTDDAPVRARGPAIPLPGDGPGEAD